jgi:hypothetical protein
LKELQTGILLTSFSDIHFQSLAAVPLVSFTKIQKFWVGRVWLAEELFYYKYPFHLPGFFHQKLKKHQFEVQVQVFKTFSSEGFDCFGPLSRNISCIDGRVSNPIFPFDCKSSI